jgi:nucleoside-diphosphate-sugar epimerase
MKVLVLGGSGFVSGTLARTALAQGHQVWTLTRGQRLPVTGVVSLQADRHDQAALIGALDRAGVVWDLAVDCIGYQAADARQDLEVLTGRVGHLVFISTDFVFDPARRRFPQPDDSPWFTDHGYGGDKRRGEEVLLAAGPDPLPWTVLRPCHIYGPGSLLGCLPRHGRDADLVDRLRRGEALALVGGGHFLQQPVYAPDLADLILSCAGNAAAVGAIFPAAGPDIIESREYYRLLAANLGADLRVTEVPVTEHLAAHPEAAPFLCHRIYSLQRLAAARLRVPSTPVAVGLQHHLASLLS